MKNRIFRALFNLLHKRHAEVQHGAVVSPYPGDKRNK